GPQVPELRVAMERRRQSRSPLIRLVSWLLGFELKLRQYREGKAWADEVAATAGIGAVNEAWRDRASLPAPAEIAEPSAWLARTASRIAT
ncbi:MAG: zinc-dependent metalloprotease, partial [Solirubrobacterales bacterium]